MRWERLFRVEYSVQAETNPHNNAISLQRTMGAILAVLYSALSFLRLPQSRQMLWYMISWSASRSLAVRTACRVLGDSRSNVSTVLSAYICCRLQYLSDFVRFKTTLKRNCCKHVATSSKWGVKLSWSSKLKWRSSQEPDRVCYSAVS